MRWLGLLLSLLLLPSPAAGQSWIYSSTAEKAIERLLVRGNPVTCCTITDIYGTGGTPHWIWPTSDGTSGQALTTNGSGVLSFTTISSGAPADAAYWVSTANGSLSNEVNLGALTTGLVLNTVAVGVGTPSSVNTSAGLAGAISDETGSGALVFGTSPTFAPAVNGIGITVTGATNTASAPAVSLTETWNNGAVVFTHFKSNVTATAHATTSKLYDWQVGGVSKQWGQWDGSNFFLFNAGTLMTQATARFGDATGNWLTNDPVIVLATSSTQGQIGVFGSGGSPRIAFTATANAENGQDVFIGRDNAAGRLLVDGNGTVASLRITATTFANLGTPAVGTMSYCSDCDAPAAGVMATCTSAGAKTGAWAYRVNSTPVWGCIGI